MEATALYHWFSSVYFLNWMPLSLLFLELACRMMCRSERRELKFLNLLICALSLALPFPALSHFKAHMTIERRKEERQGMASLFHTSRDAREAFALVNSS